MKKIPFLTSAFLLALLIPALSNAEDGPKSREEQAREKIVAYMRDAASIEWTPKVDIPYWTEKQNFTFKAGVKYYGEPYTQWGRDHDLDSFKTQLEVVDGVAVYVGPSESATYWGTDCSSTVSHAWRRIDPDFPTLSTADMLPDFQKKIVAVGTYQSERKRSTKEIAQANGFDVMKKAYAQLKPGDAVLYRISAGHVMLVVKNEPEKERLFIIDQTGCTNGVPEGRDGRSTLRVDCEIGYEKLFKSNYIPIRLKAVDDLARDEKAK